MENVTWLMIKVQACSFFQLANSLTPLSIFDLNINFPDKEYRYWKLYNMQNLPHSSILIFYFCSVSFNVGPDC